MHRATIRIEDPDDPRVAPYRDIRERDLAGRRGFFIAEGKVVLNVLFASGRFEAESALILENRLDGLRETLAAAPAAMPVYVATSHVMDAVAGFHIHRGVLALGRRGPPSDCAALIRKLPPRALVVALVGISNHDNMGAIFRNAAALGAQAVMLDATCCDPLYRKAIRVSVGASLKVPYAVAPDTRTLLEALGEGGFETLALSPAGKRDIGDARRPERLALFLGAEGSGLPQDLMDRMETARIPIAPGFDSLNVAAASAIALHRLSDLERSV